MSSPVRAKSILIVLPWPPDLPGGVSVVARNLLQVWRRAGIPANLLVSDWQFTRMRTDADNLTLRLAIYAGASPLNILKGLVKAPLTLFRTWRMLKHAAATDVYFHYTNLDALGILILKQLGLFRGKVALCFHGTDVRAPANQREARLWRWMLARADGITTCSRALAAQAHSVFGVSADRISVVYNGTNPTIFSPLQAKALAVSGLPERYIISIGGFIALKGHRFLLEAFAEIAQEQSEIGLVIVGGHGAELESLQEWIKVRDLDARIKLRVDLTPEQVAQVAKGAALCVQPSLTEAFGMAVIEAGACGVPVAASSVGGHLELIESGITGLLFAPADPVAIRTIIAAFLRDPAPFAQNALRFREQILARFTWAVTAERYLSILKRPA